MRSLVYFVSCIMVLVNASLLHAVSISVAFDADPVSLDPHEQLSEGTLQLSHLTYDPLLRWTQDNQFEARLATHWQRLDPNTTRFYLREGVTFHTGNPFTADDVVFTVKRLKRSVDFKAMFGPITQAIKVDNLTVDIITQQATPLLLNILTYVFPMDHKYFNKRDQIVKYGETFASRNISGTGPFSLTYREPGVRLEFTRAKNYWDQQSKGNVDHITFTPIHTDSTRLAALLSGDVDFIYPISPIDIPRAQRMSNIKLVTLRSTRILLLHMNQARRSEFRNIKVRQAINLAINQELIVEKILKGFGEAAGQLSAVDLLGHTPSIRPQFDLAKAQQLMRDAGYPEGFRLTMMAPNNRYVHDERIAQSIVAMLAKINIAVELKTLPKAQYFQEFDERSADIMMLGWQSDTRDSNNLFEFIIACPDGNTGMGAYNASNYCNPQVDNRIRSANVEMNPEKRIRLLQQIEQTLVDDAVVVPLMWQHLAWGAKKNLHIEQIVNEQNYPFLGDLLVE